MKIDGYSFLAIALGAALSLGTAACSNERAADRQGQNAPERADADKPGATATDSGARGGAAGDFGRGRDAGSTTVPGEAEAGRSGANARGGIRTDNPEDMNRKRDRNQRSRTGGER